MNEKIIEKLECIEKDIADIKAQIQLISFKYSNQHERLENLEVSNLRTIKNCAENIPKVKNVCKISKDTQDDIKKLRTQAIIAMGSLIFSMFLLYLHLK